VAEEVRKCEESRVEREREREEEGEERGRWEGVGRCGP